LLSDIRELLSYSGLYIKTEFYPSVPLLLGPPVLLNIFGMIGSVLLEVTWMLIKPSLDPSIVVTLMIGIGSSPSRIAFCFKGFLAGGLLTDLLILTAASWGWNKKALAVGALPRRHLRFL
jgi:hypothetical protein